MPIRQYPFSAQDPSRQLRPFLPIILRNPHVGGSIYSSWGQIDTGADWTAIPGNVASLIGHNINAGRQRKCGTGAGEVNGYDHEFIIEILEMTNSGTVTGQVIITIPSRQITVLPGLEQILLGVGDFLDQYILTIDYPKQTFSISAPTK